MQDIQESRHSWPAVYLKKHNMVIEFFVATLFISVYYVPNDKLKKSPKMEKMCGETEI